jgi:hypothetical protein
VAREPRHRGARGRVGLVVGALVLSAGLAACAAPLSNAPGNPSQHGTTAPGAGTVVLVCESGTQSNGGVDTSSAVAVRVPAGTPVPPGCRLG